MNGFFELFNSLVYGSKPITAVSTDATTKTSIYDDINHLINFINNYAYHSNKHLSIEAKKIAAEIIGKLYEQLEKTDTDHKDVVDAINKIKEIETKTSPGESRMMFDAINSEWQKYVLKYQIAAGAVTPAAGGAAGAGAATPADGAGISGGKATPFMNTTHDPETISPENNKAREKIIQDMESLVKAVDKQYQEILRELTILHEKRERAGTLTPDESKKLTILGQNQLRTREKLDHMKRIATEVKKEITTTKQPDAGTNAEDYYRNIVNEKIQRKLGALKLTTTLTWLNDPGAKILPHRRLESNLPDPHEFKLGTAPAPTHG